MSDFIRAEDGSLINLVYVVRIVPARSGRWWNAHLNSGTPKVVRLSPTTARALAIADARRLPVRK